MSNNYHINFNPKEPSSEQIAKHRNFDGLLEQFNAEQQQRRPARIRHLAYRWGAAAAIAALVFFITLSNQGSRGLTEEQYFADQPFVHPPIENLQKEMISRRIDAAQGGVIEYESGSRLVVPTTAFMDDRGRLVEGEVDIYYQELHDFIDFFLAGVPMVYDSAGVKYHLESAGMVEIYAVKNGQRVTLAPGKTIEVEMVSEIILPNIRSAPEYFVYKLDTLSRNWAYQDIDHIQVLMDEVLDEADPLYPMKKELFAKISEIELKAEEKLQAINASIPKPGTTPSPSQKER